MAEIRTVTTLRRKRTKSGIMAQTPQEQIGAAPYVLSVRLCTEGKRTIHGRNQNSHNFEAQARGNPPDDHSLKQQVRREGLADAGKRENVRIWKTSGEVVNPGQTLFGSSV